MRKQLKQVLEFQKAFRVDVKDKPSLADLKQCTLRTQLLTEENREYMNAAINGDLTEIADALADQLYIVLGSIHLHGLQDHIGRIFDEVHLSNMSKMGHEGKPIYDANGKIVKGPYYFKPMIKEILQGIRIRRTKMFTLIEHKTIDGVMEDIAEFVRTEASTDEYRFRKWLTKALRRRLLFIDRIVLKFYKKTSLFFKEYLAERIELKEKDGYKGVRIYATTYWEHGKWVSRIHPKEAKWDSIADTDLRGYAKPKQPEQTEEKEEELNEPVNEQEDKHNVNVDVWENRRKAAESEVADIPSEQENEHMVTDESGTIDVRKEGGGWGGCNRTKRGAKRRDRSRTNGRGC